jgi:hypothetical protein
MDGPGSQGGRHAVGWEVLIGSFTGVVVFAALLKIGWTGEPFGSRSSGAPSRENRRSQATAMRVVRTITTPWAPYSVMFSRDGTRLAIGGGSWYGEGGILLVNLSSQDTTLFPCANLPAPGRQLGPFTVSGICFSPDDRHLAVSTWSSRQHAGPSLLFEVSGLQLTHRETLPLPRRLDQRDPTPTGVLLSGKYLITRSHRASVEDVVTVSHPSRAVKIDRGAAPNHLASSRMIVARQGVMTACGGLIPMQELEADPDWRQSGRAADGLVAVPLKGGQHEVEVIPAQDCRRITAIGARPAEEKFMTGGRDGEVDAWLWEGGWRQRRLRPATNRKAPDSTGLDITWATYTPNSIVGICSLAEDTRWASASADGEICIWDEDSLVCSWQLPERGTARSLAAHPDKPWIAVGVKKGGFGRPQSAVVIVEVSPLALDPSWRTPTVLGLARAADEERISPNGSLDPARLAILADALEDTGCADVRLLNHLRNHDHRLRGCWVVDALLNKEGLQ